MNRTLLALAAVAAIAATACSSDPSDAARPSTSAPTAAPSSAEPPSTGSTSAGPHPMGFFGNSRIASFSSCPDLLGHLQQEALDRVTAWGLDGGGYYYGPMMMDMAGGTAAPSVEMANAPATTAAAYSTTNTQEVGVDEGDVVETDGAYVYVAGQDGVRVIEVASADVVATIHIPQGSHQLILDGTTLLVVTQPYSGAEDTIASTYDVSNGANPTLLRRSHLEGRLVATRSVDGRARLVVTTTLARRLPFVRPDQFGMDETRALEANREVIRNSTIEDWLPRTFDELGDGSFGSMSATLDCTAVAAPRDFAGLGITWIASLDLRSNAGPVGTAGVVSLGDMVYASPSSLYIATVPWDWNRDGTETTSPPTLIHRFDLGADGSDTYVASGEVAGHLVNQFAMSESDGDLRVATTLDSWTGNGASESFVEVLRPDGDELRSIGKIGGLGLTEQVYAVRFLGSQAYVVTFRQTDPLYIVDLSDPTAPRLSGELHMPGYSSYLHPVGDGLLLGIGQNADLAGRTTGTQLSLFDVSDPSNPQLVSSLQLGGSSEAEWDHHAFLYWPEDGTIVIPTSPMWGPCGASVGCLAAGITNPGGGVVVAQLQGRTLTGRGVIQHDGSTTSTGCWNPLQRSLVVGSEIVTIGLDEVLFSDRTTLAARAAAHWHDEAYGCMYTVEG